MSIDDFLSKKYEEYLQRFMSHVSDEVKVIVDRGTLTLDQFKEMRLNSFERQLLVPMFNDDDFVQWAEEFLVSGQMVEMGEYQHPSTTYQEQVCERMIFQLIRRFKKILKT